MILNRRQRIALSLVAAVISLGVGAAGYLFVTGRNEAHLFLLIGVFLVTGTYAVFAAEKWLRGDQR